MPTITASCPSTGEKAGLRRRASGDVSEDYLASPDRQSGRSHREQPKTSWLQSGFMQSCRIRLVNAALLRSRAATFDLVDASASVCAMGQLAVMPMNTRNMISFTGSSDASSIDGDSRPNNCVLTSHLIDVLNLHDLDCGRFCHGYFRGLGTQNRTSDKKRRILTDQAG
jgi:hypothetical protein